MIGRTLAHFEITALLGKGGMGEVYRARDTKLGREVALKVLPRELSVDPERAARFEREARVLASLQHANVASIYGYEDIEGVRFLAMELVEGENLAQRMARGRVPLTEALHVARQMAAGLEAAHEKGIVHRDLKPSNVMLSADGDVKILDFGLARAWFGEATDETGSMASPTITTAMTQAGTILGTAAYMSPEQARGRNVDRRADIWAFGAILWELATGTQLFEGETISDTLAAVLRAEIEWEKLPVEEAPLLSRLIERCLVRDPRQRLRDIGEARILLQEGGAQTSHLSFSGAAATIAEPEPSRAGLPWPALIVAAVLLLGVGALVGWKLLASPSPAPVLHTMIPPPRGAEFDLSSGAPGPSTLSPDETMVAFTARDGDGVTRVYLRHLDRGESVSLSGTENAAYPFWSPDSRFLGFFTPNADRKLKKIAVAGGPPVTLCNAENGKGGTWNADGTIAFAPSHDTPIFRVPAIGGDPVAVTELATGEISHRHPRFLPNGRDLLYLVRGRDTEELHQINVTSLDGGEPREITRSQCQVEYSAGHLLTAREHVLLATPFDLSSFALTGGATPIVEDLLVISAGAAAGAFSSSSKGMLTFQTGIVEQFSTLQWVSMENEGVTPVGTAGQLLHPRISPDGTKCLVEVRGESEEGIDLWMVDLETGRRERFTFEAGDEVAPVWMPDGKSVLYVSRADSVSRIVRQPVEGVGGATVLFESERGMRTTSVSPDGSMALFDFGYRGVSTFDIFALPLDVEDPQPREIRATPEREGGARFSPNGRWIAYHADSSNTFDIFVMPAAGGSRKWQITNGGAVFPQWTPDGRELLSDGLGGIITAHAVDTSGESFRVAGSREVASAPGPTSAGVAFDVAPDGQRLLVAGPDPAAKAEISLIHLVTDWRRALVR